MKIRENLNDSQCQPTEAKGWVMGRDGGGGGEGGEAERRDKEMVHIRFFPFSNGVLK